MSALDNLSPAKIYNSEPAVDVLFIFLSFRHSISISPCNTGVPDVRTICEISLIRSCSAELIISDTPPSFELLYINALLSKHHSLI